MPSQPQLNNLRRLGIAATLLLTGCTDGLLYQMKGMNPYYRQQWDKDRELGPTFVERLDEMRFLQSRLPSMTADQQLLWSGRLEKLITDDPSAEMRSLAVETIATLKGEATIRGLNAASTDPSEKVRLIACKAWRQVGGAEATDMLQTMAVNTKETPSVRAAAITSLGAFAQDDVKSSLARLLDEKSPVLQYHAALSLKEITGRDYGGDMQAWRDYMSGQDVPEPERSLMASFWSSLGLSR